MAFALALSLLGQVPVAFAEEADTGPAEQQNVNNNQATETQNLEDEQLAELSRNIAPLEAVKLGTTDTYYELANNADIAGKGKTLTITGTGAMPTTYNTATRPPWEDYKNFITRIDIGAGVTTVAKHAFYQYPSITSVTLASTVTTVGDSAFNGCTNLSDAVVQSILDTPTLITLGASVFANCTSLNNITIGSQSSLGDSLFNNCSNLTSIDLGSTLTSLPASFFAGCAKLTTVTGGDLVTSIGNSCFSGCALLSDSVANKFLANVTNWTAASQGTNAFRGCTSLTSITLGAGIKSLGNSAFDGCTNLANITVNGTITTLGTYVFRNCIALTGTSATNVMASVTGALPIYVFQNCTGLTDVTIGAEITSIGNYAFDGCTGLESITLGTGITSIGNNVFQNCTNLANVTVNGTNSITLGNLVFQNCEKLTSQAATNILALATSTGNSTFQGCTSLTSITLGTGITSIGTGAFQDCTNLTDVTVSGTLTSLGTNAFADCKKLNDTSVNGILAKSTTLGSNTFRGCEALTNLNIGNVITTLPSGVFSNCTELVSLTFGTQLVTVQASAFAGCKKLPNATANAILAQVTTIGNNAFEGCEALTDITLGNQITSLPTYLFKNCTSLTAASANSILTRFNTLGVGTFSGCSALDAVVLGNQTNLPNYLFQNCTGLTGATIGTMMAKPGLTFGEGVFAGCPGVADITLPASMTTLPAYFFQNCTNLTNDAANRVLAQVTTIGAGAFEGCTGLTDITIGSQISSDTALPQRLFLGCTGLTDDSVNRILGRFTTVGASMFQGCTSLTNIVLGNQITAVPNSLFNGCTGLASVALGNDVATVGSGVFGGCANLETIDLSNTKITQLQQSTFQNCTLLKNVSLPDTLTQISGSASSVGAFENCTSLQYITLPASVATIQARAFKDCTGLQGSGAVTILYPEKCTITAGAFAGTNLNTPGSVVMSYETITALPEFLDNSLAEGSRAFPAGLLVSQTNNGFTTIGTVLTSVASDASTITLPAGVTAIGPDAFKDHLNLVSVQGMEQIEFIGANAFNNCINLEKITIPIAVTKLLGGTFNGCSALEEIDIQGEVTLSNGTSVAAGNILPYPRFMRIPEGVVSIADSKPVAVPTLTTGMVYPTIVLPSTLKAAKASIVTNTNSTPPFIFANPNKELVIDNALLMTTGTPSHVIGGTRTIHGAYTQAVFDKIKSLSQIDIFQVGGTERVAPTIEPHQIAPETITAVGVGTNLVDVDCAADYCFFDTTGKDLDVVTVAAADQELTNTNFQSAVPAWSVLAGYDISWVEKNGFAGDSRQDGVYERTSDFGTLRVSLPAEAIYNDQTATILKYNANAAGTPEDPYLSTIGTAVVSSGSLTFDTTELGSFAVAYQVAVSGVSLDLTDKTIEVGKDFDLVATVAPESASNKAVDWTSSDDAVATVDASGKVSAKATGTADITVTTVDGNKTAVCKVTVEDNNVQEDAFETQIFAGKARQDTAAQVALEAYPQVNGGAAGVIIANGEGQGQTGKFPDALAASSLAGLLDYPILLTAPDALPSYTADALTKLNPQQIIILGDTKSISAAVVSALKANNPAAGEPVRLQGANRIDTAVAIYNYGKNLGSGWGKTAIFADAGNFPDALAIAPLAGNKHFPIFLVQGDSLSDSVKAVFTSASFSDAIIVGSSKSVSDGVATQIKAVIGKDANRLEGANRYQTAVKIAAYSVQSGLSYDKAGIATGENFPDALTGGPLLAKRGSVVLLATDGNTATLDLIKGNKTINKIHIFGDTPAVSTKIYQAIEDRLGLARGTIKK